MKAGDCFLLEQMGASIDSHFWMVLSDPEIDPLEVVIVNLTSWTQNKDQTCVLHPGDHIFVRHDSCVNYSGAKAPSDDQLSALKDNGLLKLQPPLTEAVLRRIREGAGTTLLMKIKYVRILKNQGLI